MKKLILAVCALSSAAAFAEDEVEILREAISIPKTAWFDTGYVVKGHPKVFMRMNCGGYGWNNEYFGMETKTDDYFAFHYNNGSSYVCYGSSTETKVGAPGSGLIEYACDNYVTYNGATAKGDTAFAPDHNFSANTQALCFPGRNQRDNTLDYHSFRIDDDGVTKRDMVAARKGDELGFYDRVEKKFYSMSGSGTLSTKTVQLVCTWTGAGADNKWSTAENWDYPPQGGKGELLVFPTRKGSLDVCNDLEGLTVATIRCGQNEVWQNGTVRLSGNAVTLTDASKPWENFSEAVLDLPLVFDRGGAGDAATGTIAFQCRNSNTVNGSLTIRGAVQLNLIGSLFNGTSAYGGTINNTFNGPITGPLATLNIAWDNSFSANGVFNGKLTLGTFRYEEDWSGSVARIKRAGNEIGTVCSRYGVAFYIDVPDAFPGARLNFDHTISKWATSAGIQFCAGDQTLDRITEGPKTWLDGVADGVKNGYDYSKCDKIVLQSSKASLFRLQGTDNALSYCWFDNYPISLSWEPVGDFTQDFRDRTHLNWGTISVSRGTFRVSGTNAFQNVTGLYVHRGATLDVATTADCAAFPAAQELLLGENALCCVTNGAVSPLTSGNLFVSVGAGAKFRLGAGSRVDCAFLRRGSAAVTAGTYTQANAPEWIEGEGEVVVSGSWTRTDNVWLGGPWDEATSWSAGVPTETSDLTLVSFDEDVDMPVSPSAQAKSITARGDGGLLALSVAAGSGDWGVQSLTLGVGSRLDIPVGAAVKIEEGKNVSVSGGELRVTGGELVVTNYTGTFTVSGNSVATGRVVLASGLLGYSTKTASANYRLTVQEGGELIATGGVFRLPSQASNSPGTRMQGGVTRFGGNVDIQSSIYTYITGEGKLATSAKNIVFSKGETVFEDDAVLHVSGGTDNMYVKQYANDEIARLVVRGRAYFQAVNQFDGFEIGSKDSTHYRNAKAILELDSEHDMVARLGYWTVVGTLANAGEMIVRRSWFSAGPRGLQIGGSPGGQYNKTVNAGGAHGLFRMYGGACYIPASATVNSEGIFTGLTLGDGSMSKLPLDAKGSYTGRVEIVGGVMTNNNGCTVIGGARGLGFYEQTGGFYYHKSTSNPFYLGLFGGEGSVTLGGGEMLVKANCYIGGALTNVVSGFEHGVQYYESSYPTDVHTSVGAFTMTGGVFTCEKTTMLGMDGTASLSVSGSLGSFATKDLVISNTLANASLSFAFDADGVTPLQVSGKVVNTAGTKLVVDVGDTQAKRKNRRLIRCAEWEGPAITDVTFVGERAGEASLRTDALGLYVSLPNGSMVLVR